MTYYSQYGQDKFLDENIFKKMEGGVFLEMGADDGVMGSNTLFFERERNWSGLCVEPRPEAFQKLIKNRRSKAVNVAVSKDTDASKKFLQVSGELSQLSGLVDTFDPRHLERIRKDTVAQGVATSVINVPSMTINEILERNGLNHIDYFSLDTEGGELEILESLDFNRFTIFCISVENKYEDKNIYSFLVKMGYRKLTRIRIDDIFILRSSPFNFYREPLNKRFGILLGKCKQNFKKIMGFNNFAPRSLLRKIKKNGLNKSFFIFQRRVMDKINNIGIIEKIRIYQTSRSQIKFYEKHIGRNKLIFDVGANMGSKTDYFLRLGAKVVAIEPQSDFAAYLRVKYNSNLQVSVEECGLGASLGESLIHISSKYPGFSSMNDSWQSGSKYDTFDKEEKIKIDTLDSLVHKHGLPYFAKIDVEGSEPQVLAGLSEKIPIINFEFHSNDPELVQKCLEKLSALGYEKFNFVIFENPKMASKEWFSGDELWPMIKNLERDKKIMIWGDVYAK